MLRVRPLLGLMLGMAVALSGCDESPVDPAAEVQFAKGENGGRGGGPKDPPPPALTLEFADRTVEGEDKDKFRSDGEGLYVNGVNKTVITVERQLIFDPDEGGKKPAPTPRKVCLNFVGQDAFDGEIICDQGGFRTTAHSNGSDGLIGMDVGTPIQAQARFIWADEGANVEYKILFRCAEPDDPDPDDPDPDPNPPPFDPFDPACAVTVDHPATNTWIVSFPATELVALQSRSMRGNNPFVTIDSVSVPFQMTVSQPQ